MVPHETRTQTTQNGNVLFLALIACVLFVALVYVVLHTYRGRQNSERMIDFKASAVATQYASAIRTGVTRLLLRGVPLSELDFSAPQHLASDAVGQTMRMVFNPAGGGVTYSETPSHLVTELYTHYTDFGMYRNGNWYFTATAIPGVGTSQKDMVAFLYNVRKKICEDINYQITGSMVVPVVEVPSEQILNGRVAVSNPVIAGQPFLCIQTADGNIYYHVLAEQ